MIHKIILETRCLSDNLVHIVHISMDESLLYLEVVYLDGQFTIEKTFKNHTYGLEELNLKSEKFNTEEKVRKYLKI